MTQPFVVYSREEFLAKRHSPVLVVTTESNKIIANTGGFAITFWDLDFAVTPGFINMRSTLNFLLGRALSHRGSKRATQKSWSLRLAPRTTWPYSDNYECSAENHFGHKP